MYQTTNDTNDRFSWDASAEAAYWQSREVSAKTEPEAITLAEMYCGNVTYIYAKVGECYFKFRDVVTLSHTAIVQRLAKEVQSQESKTQK
ncbi:hypothetical protein [Yersinia pekkanenii]|uniref:Uncharacterized protein n=1 Tax=Yersinia pekkanenii TaxID=1288385 RepID=A0ABP1ZXX2_9GAMM|nr:hypothetical protein [Yersinia pekkanenii]CRY69855.1 Uncharacterised protein [Yersinia pekkanenii]